MTTSLIPAAPTRRGFFGRAGGLALGAPLLLMPRRALADDVPSNLYLDLANSGSSIVQDANAGFLLAEHFGSHSSGVGNTLSFVTANGFGPGLAAVVSEVLNNHQEVASQVPSYLSSGAAQLGVSFDPGLFDIGAMPPWDSVVSGVGGDITGIIANCAQSLSDATSQLYAAGYVAWHPRARRAPFLRSVAWRPADVPRVVLVDGSQRPISSDTATLMVAASMVMATAGAALIAAAIGGAAVLGTGAAASLSTAVVFGLGVGLALGGVTLAVIAVRESLSGGQTRYSPEFVPYARPTRLPDSIL